MKIRFKVDCEVELAVDYNNGEPVFETILFKKGEVHEIDVVDFASSMQNGKLLPRKDFPLCEFGDGTVGTISTETFEIIEGQEELNAAFAEEMEGT